MIPLLAFAATIELECKDVTEFMDNIEKVKIIHLSEKQKKEVKEAFASFTSSDCPAI